MPKPLSAGAAAVLDTMGYGGRLRVPHGGGLPELVRGLSGSVGWDRNSAVQVLPGVVVELIAAYQIRKLTEHRNGDIVGWRECGYDGDVADWYTCIQ